MKPRKRDVYNEFYGEMLKLMNVYSEKLTPHDVGFSMILASTSMLLRESVNPLSAFKVVSNAFNAGVEQYEEDLEDVEEE